MAYHGDVRLGGTLDIKFSTIDGGGAPTTLGGSPAVAAYPDNSTTEVTAGITLSVDFDGRTGLHNVRIVHTSGNGYATATNYTLVLTAGTVGSVSVAGYVVGSFSIEARSALMPATAGRTLVVDSAGLADANTVKLGPTGSGTAQTARDIGASVLLSSGTGTGQVKLSSGYVAPNWGDVGNPTTTVGLSGTTVKTATDVETDTQDIQSRLPAALVSGRIDASVGAMAANVVTATAINADAITAAKIADGAIDAATFAAGAINAAAIASDAITGAKVAGDVTIASVTGSVGSVVAAVTLAAPQGIKKNTAYAGFQFVVYDTSGTPTAGLAITLMRSIDGGAFAAATNAVSGISDGAYTVDLSAADLNGNTILFRATATGAADTFFTIKTVTAS